MLNPSGLSVHLQDLDARWTGLLEELKGADQRRRQALYIHAKAYAKAYLEAPYTPSNDSCRKQTAIAATLTEAKDLEHWESEVRFIRDELRALGSRTDIARSLFSGVKQATT
ncbi:MAG: hypothetical protein WB777_14095 [Mycobacterium sp.]